ncbi:MAG: hypothetical protein RML99_11915 [Anaerolineae bacterium]|nr:hypothetical protein [Anaerolineae bacterium]
MREVVDSQRIALHRMSAAHLAPCDSAIPRSLSLLRQVLDKHPQVLGRLTPRWREFARSNADAATVARRLNLTQAALDSHKARILGERRIAWGVLRNERLLHRFLMRIRESLDASHGYPRCCRRRAGIS